MNRRDFLKLCSKYSLSAASFPFLHALPSLASAAELEVTQGKRFMVFYHPHGMHQPGFTCGEGHRSGNDWELSDVLAPLQPVKEKTNVIEGLFSRLLVQLLKKTLMIVLPRIVVFSTRYFLI